MTPGSTKTAVSISAAFKRRSILAALSAFFISTMTVGSSPAHAVDINGLVNAAIAIGASYGRMPGGSYGSHAARSKRGRDSDEDEGDNEDSGGNRKSASTSSQSHKPAPTARQSMEASSVDPNESMVTLERSAEDRRR
jgi:hypothetical protein